MIKKEMKVVALALFVVAICLGLFFAHSSFTYSKHYEVIEQSLSSCQAYTPECMSTYLKLRSSDGSIKEVSVYEASAVDKDGKAISVDAAIKVGNRIQFQSQGTYIKKIRLVD